MILRKLILTTCAFLALNGMAQSVVDIEDYSEGSSLGMSSFYNRLAQAKQTPGPVRVAYFADSWIEGDILTVDLREMLQSRFGGYGMGWIDCTPDMYAGRPTIGLRSTGITSRCVIRKPFDSALEGISQRYHIPTQGATMSLTARDYKPHASMWSRATIFFRAPKGITINMSENGEPANDFTFEGSTAVQSFTMDADSMTSLNYKFSNFGPNTYLFGAAVETPYGVTVDNLGVRGLQGNQIFNIPDTTLADFARQRPYDLIVLHFGVNCINPSAPASAVAPLRAYIEKMKQVIDKLHAAYPQASILIVSLSDTRRSTPPTVEVLEQLQREMAQDKKVSFFDLFTAMGGRGSLAQFVSQGLASSRDYIHINLKGGHAIAELIYGAIERGYDKYCSGRGQQQ